MDKDALDEAARAREASGDITPGDSYRAALKRELAGYVAAGNENRADQVRAELARLVDGADTAVDAPAVETADDTSVDAPAAKAKRRRAAAADTEA